MLAWACAFGILMLSAPTSCSSEFFYSRNPSECNLCFVKNCVTLDKARCDYYTEADSLLPKDVQEPVGINDEVKRNEVDVLVHELVGKELSNSMECIPYVTRYTNCNKENVCLGCKTCACNPDGMWNCTTMLPCHSQDPPLNIDHRVLVMIMDALTDTTQAKKTKRSVSEISEELKKKDVTDNPSNVSLEKLSQWLYAVNPFTVKDTSPTEITTDFTVIVPEDPIAIETKNSTTEPVPVSTVSKATTMAVVKETSTSSDADYIAFDEVLRNIDVDINNYTRRKPSDDINNNQAFSIEYMIQNEENATSGTPNNFAINLTLDSNNPESTVAGVTKVVIDLLETARRLGTNKNVTEDLTDFNKNEDPDVFENTNDILNYNSLNIMKREVTYQGNITKLDVNPTDTVIINANTTTPSENIPLETTDLKEKVLTPLIRIIADNRKEYENLQEIKEYLLKFVKSDSEQVNDMESNTSNTYLSVQNLTIATGLDMDLRRSNPKRYEKYMVKLKYDIFEVIRDIIGIQKYKDAEIPQDLKFLLRAMKQYVYKNQLKKNPKTHKLEGYRRNMEQPSSRCDQLSFKDCLFQIIEVIDKDIPKSNALFPLSPITKSIIKHVIKTHYTDQHTMPGLRVHDPHYSLTHYLNSIGSKWTEVAANLMDNTPFGNLHRLKLLLCIITLDISKMSDALSLVQFVHNRQMVSSLDNVNEDTLNKIDAGLLEIHNKVRVLSQYYEKIPKQLVSERSQAITESTTEPVPSTTITNSPHKHKKRFRSFIKHIRSLLKASKKDITDFLHRDVPKSEIVKQLAKKTLNEMTDKRYNEYEETMRRWQRNLEIVPRIKRSNVDHFQTRTKNIIPKYLRHKVNPRIKRNQKKATADVMKKKQHSLKLEHKATKKTTSLSRKPITRASNRSDRRRLNLTSRYH